MIRYGPAGNIATAESSMATSPDTAFHPGHGATGCNGAKARGRSGTAAMTTTTANIVASQRRTSGS